MSDARHTLSLRVLALRVLAPFAAGYFLSYLYRTVNAVLAPLISKAVHLDAGDLGLMTGVYFLAFGSFQLPLGILLDRFGPRRVEAALLLFAAAGSAAFSVAQSAETLILGRALVGLGVSACLMAALKANVQFFPPAKLPLFNGIILSAGGLGAVAATAPVQAALAFVDWRTIFVVLAFLTVAAAVNLFLVVPDRHGNAVPESLPQQLAEVGRIYRDRRFWRLLPVGVVSQAAFMAIQGLWAGPWLRDVAGLPPDGVATGLTAMAAGMAAGFLGWGVIAERAGRVGVDPARVLGGGLVLFLICQTLMMAGFVAAPLVLAVVYGFSGASSTLSYVVATRGFSPHLAGRATTSLNLGMFMGAFLMQWGLGAVIGLWPKSDIGWPAEAFTIAFAVPAVLLAASMVWALPLLRKPA
ncbi:nitrate/nitrite transporter [Magnetospirillum sp. LM-5]|uniref:MFS transporter n=1 Tax=Magnetospirillum sp. LM-5 TaxID=2681466 RepID=UPI0020C3AE05|nr:MFS transporter [Magnetospirillum sp. LM-5]